MTASRVLISVALLALPTHSYLMGGDELVCIPTPGTTINMGPPCQQFGGVELAWASPINMDPVANIVEQATVRVGFQSGSSHTVLTGHNDISGMFQLNIKACDAEVGTCFSNLTATTDTHGYIFESKDVVFGSAAGDFNLTYAFPELDICWTLVAVMTYYVQNDATNEIFRLETSIAKFQVVSSTPKVTIVVSNNTSTVVVGTTVGGGLALLIIVVGVIIYRKSNKGRIDFSSLDFNDNQPWKSTMASEVFKGSYSGTKVAIKRITKSKPKKDAESGSAYMAAADGATTSQTMKSASLNTHSLSRKKVGSSTAIIFDNNTITTNSYSQDAVAALKLEIAFLSQLRHPNCLLYLGYAEKDKYVYAVTEYMPNGSLYDVLQNPCLDFDFAHKLHMTSDIAHGLEFLHTQKLPIIHGDIKSQNIFVNEDLRGKIADFGASCIEGRSQVSGTPSWMAPELFKGEAVSCDSDIYALSMTLWELWTMAELFPEMKGKTIRELGEAIVAGKRPVINQRRTPPEISAIIERGWSEDPSSRPDIHAIGRRVSSLLDDQEFLLKHKEETKMQDHDLLNKILPPSIAEQVKNGETVEPLDVPACTILFSDIVGFTKISSSLQPKEVMNMLDRLYKEFDKLTEKHQLFKVETIGDAYMVCGGLFERQDVQASMIALQGIGMIRAGSRVMIHPERPELGTVKIRVGAHTGPVVASVVGMLNPRFCLFGDTVNTSSRMESNSIVMRFQGSKPFREKLMAEDPNFVTEYRGEVHAKGKAPMITYWIEAKDNSSVPLIEDFPMPEDKEALGAMK